MANFGDEAKAFLIDSGWFLGGVVDPNPGELRVDFSVWRVYQRASDLTDVTLGTLISEREQLHADIWDLVPGFIPGLASDEFFLRLSVHKGKTLVFSSAYNLQGILLSSKTAQKLTSYSWRSLARDPRIAIRRNCDV
tara:strand:- start:923 stop:1333 length:411 start_codon:yes stop_codon:yes gene_type:complete